jgi:H+/Cl- antiporter ClcA
MQSKVKYQLMYAARLLVLSLTTASGIFFLMWSGVLLWQLHEMPGIVTRDDILATIVLGIGSGCFGILYALLLRKTESKQRITLASLNRVNE